MQKPFFIITFCLIISSCNSKGQTHIDADASKKAFKEGADFLKMPFDLRSKDSAAFIKLNRQAIEKFELAYKYDTTNRDAWMWLPICYYDIGEFEKAIYWSKKDMNFVMKDSRLKSDSILVGGTYEDIGLSLLNLGELEQAKIQIQSAFRLYKSYDTGAGLLIGRVKDIGTHIYEKQDTKQITKLQSKNINPCNYSILVYEYAIKLYQGYYQFVLPHDETVLKKMREDCR